MIHLREMSDWLEDDGVWKEIVWKSSNKEGNSQILNSQTESQIHESNLKQILNSQISILKRK